MTRSSTSVVLRRDDVCKGGNRAPAQLGLGQHEFRSTGVCGGVVRNKWPGVRARFECCLEVQTVEVFFSSDEGGRSELKQR